MRTANCERCGKLFSRLGNPECLECREEMDGYLRQAKEYLYRNPSVGLAELSEKSEVPLESLEDLLRQGRLVLRAAAEGQLTCEMCGKSINTGRRCSKCQEKITRFVRDGASETGRTGPSMHSLGIVKQRRGDDARGRG